MRASLIRVRIKFSTPQTRALARGFQEWIQLAKCLAALWETSHYV